MFLLKNLLNSLHNLIKKRNFKENNCDIYIEHFEIFTRNMELDDKSYKNTLLIVNKSLKDLEINYLEKNTPACTIFLAETNEFKNLFNIPSLLLNTNNLSLIINFITKLQKENEEYLKKLIYNDYPRLVHLITKNSGLNEIINLASNILDNPLIITDNSYDLLAYSRGQNIDDPIWNEIVKNSYCPYHIVKMMAKEGFLNKLKKEKSPVFLEKGKFSDLIRRLVCEIKIEEEVKAFIALLEYNKKITKLDIEIMNFISSIIAAEMAKSDAITHAKGKLQDNFMLDLIQRNIKDNTSAKNRAKTLNWKTEPYFQVITIKKENRERFTGQHFHSLDSLIKKQFPESKISSSNTNIIIFLFNQKNNLNSNKLENIIEYCKDNKLYIGIGRKKEKIIDLSESYKEANKALKFNDKLNQNNTVTFYNNVNIYDIVEEIPDDNLHPAAKTILNYDKNNNTELLKTLKNYYAQGQNMNSTAKKLYVHRNTVNYRLQKIKEITQLDINKHKIRIQLELSLMKMELKN